MLDAGDERQQRPQHAAGPFPRSAGQHPPQARFPLFLALHTAPQGLAQVECAVLFPFAAAQAGSDEGVGTALPVTL